MTAAVSGRPRVFYGWWIVAAAIPLQAYVAGAVFWSFSFFVSPMQETLGWSAATIGLAYLVGGYLAIPLAPVMGSLFDRLGPKVVAGGGALMGGLGFILWGRAESLWLFFLGYNLASFAFICVITAAMSSTANWFLRRRGLALGLASLGIALAGGMAPIVLALINAVGWRAALLLIGLGCWAILFPLALVLRRRPEEHGLLPDGELVDRRIAATPVSAAAQAEGATAREAVRSLPFWLLGYIFLMGFWAIGAIQVYQSPYLTGAGVSEGMAALAIALLSLLSVIGRVVFGWLADRMDVRLLTASALALNAAGVVVFALIDGSRAWLLAVFLLTFPIAFGALNVLQPALQGYYFGRRAFGAISGFGYAFNSVSWSGGPWVMGVLLGVFEGSYRPGFLLFAALSLAGLPALLFLRRRTDTPVSDAPPSITSSFIETPARP
jgi:MFS family permease